VAGGLTQRILDLGAAGYGAAWELRRRAYAAGWLAPRQVPARVVSIGNLTVGGTGKTTLTLHLAERARERGLRAAVVCRNYRPGPGGRGDEALLYEQRLGQEQVFSGDRKLDLAAHAATRGFGMVLVDDGFSHWALARDLDLVLLDAGDLFGGGALLPRGRLREPLRALQRAEVVVISRLGLGEDPKPYFDRVRPYAPAALLAGGRHRVTGVHVPAGVPRPTRALVVTATGNPDAVAASARETGLEVVALSAYRDHHWFRPEEMACETERARAADACLLLTAKDAVRWSAPATNGTPPPLAILEVGWQWVAGGDEVEHRVFDDGSAR
jgi:tetraacyldisaccharide 4'-kinase